MTVSPPPRVDVSAWIGSFPFRELPHPDAEVLATRVLQREGFTGAWVGHLPGAFQRDPRESNRALYRLLAPYRETLNPAPIVRPDWPRWESTLDEAIAEGASSVRIYPAQWGLAPGHRGLEALAVACGERGVVLHVTVRFEDLRQRHALDIAGDVSGALLRGIARVPGSHCHLVVAGAGRDLVEEVHWGLTPDESSRVWYDFGWMWGPPEDQFEHLVRSMGPDRLAWGTFWPFRLTQQCRSLIDLLPKIDGTNTSYHAFAEGTRIRDAARRKASVSL